MNSNNAKTILITGGTGGIGTAIAHSLASKGYRLILVGQNRSKGQTVVGDLILKTKHTDIEFWSADLSRMDQVKDLCSRIKAEYPTLSGIVFAAGALASQRTETPDGIELVLAMQYLNRLVMTHHLADLFSASNPGKMSWLGAPILPFAKLNCDNLQLKTGYWLPRAMAQVQLAAHVMVQTLAKRYSDTLRINIVSPGLVNTELVNKITGPIGFLGRLVLPLIANSATLAAQNVVTLLDDPDYEQVTGAFFPKPGCPERHTKINYPDSWGHDLWLASFNILHPHT